MSFSQTDVETISASAATTVSVTNAFSVNALADSGGSSSLSAPSSTVVDLDGVVIRVLVAGVANSSGSVSVSVNGTYIASTNGDGNTDYPFFFEIVGVWTSASGLFICGYMPDDSATGIGYEVGNAGGKASVSAQSSLTFSVSGTSSVSQFTMKLA